jgi:hypothetical protein
LDPRDYNSLLQRLASAWCAVFARWSSSVGSLCFAAATH